MTFRYDNPQTSGEVLMAIHEHDAPRCNAAICIDVMKGAPGDMDDSKRVAMLVLAACDDDNEMHPMAYMPIDNREQGEALINRIQQAMADNFGTDA